MTPRFGRSVVLLLTINTLSACVDDYPAENEVEFRNAVGCSSTDCRLQFQIPAPSNMGLLLSPAVRRTSLAAMGSLRVNDGVDTVSPSGFSSLVNIGHDTNVGVGSNVGNVLANGLVHLRDRSCVHGSVETTVGGGITLQNNVLVEGRLADDISIGEVIQFEWFTAPSDSQSPITVSPGQVIALAPGAYGSVHVAPQGTIRLSSGEYTFDSFSVEPSAVVDVNDHDGLVAVLVMDGITIRGDMSLDSESPGIFLGQSGPSEIAITTSFRGTIVAPKAKLSLYSVAAGHEGAFFARDLEIHQHQRVVSAPALIPVGSAFCLTSGFGACLGQGIGAAVAEIECDNFILALDTGTGDGSCGIGGDEIFCTSEDQQSVATGTCTGGCVEVDGAGFCLEVEK